MSNKETEFHSFFSHTGKAYPEIRKKVNDGI